MKLVCGWTVGGKWTLTWCEWRTFIGITGNISRNRPAHHSPNQPITAKNNSTRNGKQRKWKQNKTKQQVYFLFSFTVFFRFWINPCTTDNPLFFLIQLLTWKKDLKLRSLIYSLSEEQQQWKREGRSAESYVDYCHLRESGISRETLPLISYCASVCVSKKNSVYIKKHSFRFNACTWFTKNVIYSFLIGWNRM